MIAPGSIHSTKRALPHRSFEQGSPPLQALCIADGRLLQGPVSVARSYVKVRPVPHRDPDCMKLPWLAALRLEAENVLAMHLFAYQLNGLLQSILLQEIQGPPTGGLRKQTGKIRLVQPHQFSEPVHQTTRSQICRNWSLVGGRAHTALLELDPFRFGL